MISWKKCLQNTLHYVTKKDVLRKLHEVYFVPFNTSFLEELKNLAFRETVGPIEIWIVWGEAQIERSRDIFAR